MNLVWHIIKKDIRHDRWALFGWALLFVGQIGLGVAARLGHATAVTDLQLANAALILLEMVMGYILVARFVQTDPLMGTTGFWPTRPISARRLLAAKALGALLVFGLGPALLFLPWWLYCDFGWQDILWTAVETVGWQLLMIAPALLVASLTDDLGRVLLWSLLLLIGVFMWMVLVQSSLGFMLFGPARKGDAGVVFTRVLLAAAVFVTMAMGVAAHQFVTRRWFRSIGLAVLGLGLAVVLGQVCYWDWSGSLRDIARPAPGPAPAGLMAGLDLSVGQGWQRVNPNPRLAGLRDTTVVVSILARGLPAGMNFVGQDIAHTWRWPNGLTIKRQNWYGYGAFDEESVLRDHYALAEPPADPETRQWYQEQSAKEKARLLTRGFTSQGSNRPKTPEGLVVLSANVGTPKSIVAKFRTEAPVYEASLDVVLSRPVIELELPITGGGTITGGSKTMRVLAVTPENDRLNWMARVVLTAPSVVRNGFWQAGAVAPYRYRALDSILAVNRHTGDIRSVGHTYFQHNLQVGGVVLGWESLWLRPRTLVRGGKFILQDEQWQEHTSLVLLAERVMARERRTVKTEKFEMAPKDSDQGSAAAH